MWPFRNKLAEQLAVELERARTASAEALAGQLKDSLAVEAQVQRVADQLAIDLSEVRAELTSEIHRRVSAEAIAEDRAQQLERAYELLNAANEERQEANRERLKSLDLVNTALLSQAGPEKPPPDIKQFTAIHLKKRQSAARQADALLTKFLMDKTKPKRPAPTEETPAQVN